MGQLCVLTKPLWDIKRGSEIGEQNNEELHNLSTSSNITRVIKKGRIRGTCSMHGT
jgi:hypothetical protein